jgi:DNA invertase Pin-like site-specific DNA recombinase
MATGSIPIALYFRMSTDKQEDSIDRQRSLVLPYCERHGYGVVAEFSDEGISGSEIERRPGFQRMLREARSGAFQGIVCDDKDRFGRFDSIDLGEIVAPLRRKGVWLETVSQGRADWQSFAGRISDAAAQEAKNLEQESISRRVLSGMILKAREGKPTGGRPLYGYVVEYRTEERPGKPPKSVPVRLVPSGRPADVVRLVFRLYDEGLSLLEVSQELYRRGVPSPRGRPRWSRKVLQQLLRNRRYVGDFTWGVLAQGKRSRYAGGGLKAVGRHERSARNRPEDWLVLPDVHEPLVSREQFERVQARLTRNKGMTTPRPGGGSFALNQLIVCGRCGSVLSGITRGDGKRQYACRGYLSYGKSYCFRHAVAESTLLDYLLRALRSAFLDTENLARLREEVARQHERDRAAPNLAKIRGRVAELDRFIAQGNERIVTLPAELVPGVAGTVQGFVSERRDALAELERIERAEAQGSLERAVADTEAALWRLSDAVRDGDAHLLREVLREMVERVELHWDRQDKGAKTYCRLARGIVWLRTPDDMWKLSPSAKRWYGSARRGSGGWNKPPPSTSKSAAPS